MCCLEKFSYIIHGLMSSKRIIRTESIQCSSNTAKRQKNLKSLLCVFLNGEKTLLKGKYCKWKFKKTISSFLHCKWRIEDNFSEQWSKHKGFLFENCFIMKYPAFCTAMVEDAPAQTEKGFPFLFLKFWVYMCFL